MRSLILQAEEEVVAVFRQSRAVLVLPAVASAALILLPVWYAVRYELLSALAFWLLLWSLVVLVWLVGRVYLWHRETYTITTKRLVKSVHEKIFQQVVSETALDRILNVSYRTTGAWSVVGKFGNVDVQVVGRLEPIVVKAVHDPAVMKEFLWRLHEQATNRGGRFEEANAEQVLPSQHYSPRRN